jgi:hypothetical protein
MSSDAAYTPGSWVAVGADAGWLLVDIDPTDPIVLKTWSLLRGGAEVDEILDAVLERGLRAVRSFALVRVSGERRAVVVRGTADATITIDGAEQPVRPEGVATWREYLLPANAAAVRLRASGDTGEDAERPLAPGVTLASSIRLALGDQQLQLPRDTPAAPAMPASSAATNLNGSDQTPVPAPPPPVPSFAELSAPDRTTSFGPRHGAESAAPEPPAPQPPASEPLTPEPLTPEVPTADLPAALDRPAALDPAALEPQAQPAPPDPPAEPPAEAVGATAWQPPPPTPEPAGPSAWSAPPAASPDSTVSRSSLMDQSENPEPSASMVQAVRCQHGHLSPPMAVSCRVCGFPLMGQAPVTVPRPTLGVLRLSTGDVVPLDRTVIMGRNPKADETNEAERPHVVRLPSPGHDISRTHIEIRLDGWHVLLTDLNSVNGTVVTPPWQEPQRLRPNEAVPIEPGTVVSLADEVTFRYEVAG